MDSTVNMQSPMQALMVQGATSDAGKSVLVAGLCRVLHRYGVNVAPFKPQNMALNSAVTSDGGEIGRAQAVQAKACRLAPTVHMNPVLLKPNSDTGSQVIIQGKATVTTDAIGFSSYKKYALPYVMQSFELLQQEYDTVLIEGAGSPAEINLRQNDIANMGFAEEADIPVIVVADIDRGGVFAHLYGTLALLSQSEQDRVIGFVINRFRGDIALLEPGLEWLENKTNKPVLGVLPYLHGFDLEAEDAINTEQVDSEETKIHIAVPVLKRISNHTDFDILRQNPDINLRFVGEGSRLDKADLIILPGSKSVRSDLDYLREQGWDKDIARHIRLGGKVLGICGGYQMLGQWIHDPTGIESSAGSTKGLGYLDTETELKPGKTLTNVTGSLTLNEQTVPVWGYEIHAGVTTVEGISPITLGQSKKDGAVSSCNHIMGSYLHGIFDSPDVVSLVCRWAGSDNVQHIDHDANQERAIDRIADSIEQYIDLKSLWPDLVKQQ